MAVIANDGGIDRFIRIVLLVAILAWTFQILYPLLGILAWGMILAVILYPFYARLHSLLGGRSLLAACGIIAAVLLLVIGTSVFITNDITRTVSHVTTNIHLHKEALAKIPTIFGRWPVVEQAWVSLLENFESIVNQYASTLTGATKYFVEKLLNMSEALLLFLISIIFSACLLVYAETLMKVVHKLAKRIDSEFGPVIINLIRNTIQNVSRGVLGIAILQTFIFGILLLIAQVPGTALLCLLALIFSIIQAGLFLVVIPVVIWLFLTKSFVFASVITILLILDTLVDSFLKPLVLARGLETPMLIIFIGLLGGILTYGFIGIFVGPVVLAISYDLMRRWIA